MTNKNDLDLQGLFSTRERQSNRPSKDMMSERRTGSNKADNFGEVDERDPLASQSDVSLTKIVEKEVRKELGGDQEIVGDITEADIGRVVDNVCRQRGYTITDLVRADIIVNLKRDLMGWGVIQPLIDDPEVTDIHCYDYRTVVLQRGKISELTGLRWPNQESYSTFIDRVLFRLGKSFSTQQHTVDASFPDGKRVCAVHQSVCGARGPLITIRVPRIYNATLESLLSYKVAPPLIINYMAAIIRSAEHTVIVAGETGTGKTTLMRCLGTQFRGDESIIGIEDTPELNYQHPFYRSLVSRPPNTEGMGEVTLQQHIKTTLRLCPSRVILGEMRTPEAAEAFLESAQTGHTGMATVHARNARETLTRLESLLGRAQRGVAVEVIRQQISLAVSVVIWNYREKISGRVRTAEVMEVGHMVEGNIQVRPMFKLVEEGDNPKWEVLSWATYFPEELEKCGIHLGDAPQYLTFGNS